MKDDLILTICISTISIIILISTLGSISAQENMKDSDFPKFLAIQKAESGSISKVNATNNLLELQDVSDPVLFSDRPDRIVETESTQQFLDEWYNTDTENNSFFLDPPNAALIIDGQEGQDVVIVELFEPAYDYDTNILVYSFNYLNNTTDKLPSEFGKTTLLIDKFNFGPNPGDG